MPAPPLIWVSASPSAANRVSSPALPLIVSRPDAARDGVVAGATGRRVVARPAVDDVVAVVALDGVDAGPPLTRSSPPLPAQQRVVALAAVDRDARRVGLAGAERAASRHGVAAAERRELEAHVRGRRHDVRVAVVVERDAELARGERVAPGGAADRHRVGRVAERRRDLDLGRVELGRRARPERVLAEVDDEPLGRAGGAGHRDRIRVRRGGGAAVGRDRAERDLARAPAP